MRNLSFHEVKNSLWRRVPGVFTPGGDPYYECPFCMYGRCYGIEHPHPMPDACPKCGKIMFNGGKKPNE